MVKPFLIRKIKSASGIVKNFKPVVIKEKICSKQTLKKLQELLKGTVRKGTAQTINHGFYKIAGKTGTTKNFVNGKYINQYLTSYVGYFPTRYPLLLSFTTFPLLRRHRVLHQTYSGML